MIKRPVESERIYFHIILFFVVSVLLLASSVVLAYWYVFGGKKTPMLKASEPAAASQVYVNPKQQLKEIMWQKFLNFNKN